MSNVLNTIDGLGVIGFPIEEIAFLAEVRSEMAHSTV
jgi:hypothetical protein